MAKEYFEKDDVSNSTSALDAYGQCFTQGFALIYDEYGNIKTEFQAQVLSRPILTTGRESGDGASQHAKFMYQGRIKHNPSPHDYVPDPCDASLALSDEEALELIVCHTTFYSNSDLAHLGYDTPKIGDLVNVKLEPGAFSYNLADGTHLNIINTNNATVRDPALGENTILECKSLIDLFGTGEVPFLGTVRTQGGGYPSGTPDGETLSVDPSGEKTIVGTSGGTRWRYWVDRKMWQFLDSTNGKDVMVAIPPHLGRWNGAAPHAASSITGKRVRDFVMTHTCPSKISFYIISNDPDFKDQKFNTEGSWYGINWFAGPVAAKGVYKPYDPDDPSSGTKGYQPGLVMLAGAEATGQGWIQWFTPYYLASTFEAESYTGGALPLHRPFGNHMNLVDEAEARGEKYTKEQIKILWAGQARDPAALKVAPRSDNAGCRKEWLARTPK